MRPQPIHLIPAFSLVIALSLTGCEDPSASRPQAEVNDAKGGAVAADMKGPKFALNGNNSEVGFIGSKVTGSHDGGFRELSGAAVLSEDGGSLAHLEATIDMTSTWSDNERLTGHLKTDDFFDVPNHPTSRFVSTKIEPESGPDATHSITGDFTLRGVTKSITFPATVNVSDEVVTLASEFSINRMDFGVAYKGKADDLIREGVVIKLNINAER